MTIAGNESTVAALAETLSARVAGGMRFAGMFAAERHGGIALSAHVAGPGGIDTLEAPLPPGTGGYPALTPAIGAAFWYERMIHHETGLVPEGHPRLAPLIAPDSLHDCLAETPSAEIPELNLRIFDKHRGIAARFAGLTVADGTLLAERAEGIASVAHALAYCHAVEEIAGCQVPVGAALLRVVHAELERVANHLDMAMRLADAAGLAVAARFALHKEEVLRLVSQLCGSRFGRGVIVPGGVAAFPAASPGQILTAIGGLAEEVAADAELLTGASSLLDRLRGAAPLAPAGPGSTAPSAPSARRPGTPTTPGSPAPTTVTRCWASSRPPSRLTATRWHGFGSGSRRSRRLSVSSG